MSSQAREQGFLFFQSFPGESFALPGFNYSLASLPPVLFARTSLEWEALTLTSVT